jgi:hypothetical protein
VEVTETTGVAAGLEHIGKAMGQMYQRLWRICREINVFQGSNITCFTLISILTYLLSLPRSISGEIEISAFACKDGGNPQTSVRTTSIMVEIRTKHLLDVYGHIAGVNWSVAVIVDGRK